MQADASTTTVAPSTTVDQALACAQKMTQFQQGLKTLDDYRVQLEQVEQTLNAKLNAALTSNSPDVGNLEARHSAVIRQLADTQERILQLEGSKPDFHFCGSESTRPVRSCLGRYRRAVRGSAWPVLRRMVSRSVPCAWAALT